MDDWPELATWSMRNSFIGWLERRLDGATSAVYVRAVVEQFKRTFASHFGADAPIPQDVKDRVNAKLAQIKSEVTAIG